MADPLRIITIGHSKFEMRQSDVLWLKRQAAKRSSGTLNYDPMEDDY